MDTAEARLRCAVTALVADASRHIAISTAYDTLHGVPGAQGAFSIKPFYPENFFVECNSIGSQARHPTKLATTGR
jgi:hypothetical protein